MSLPSPSDPRPGLFRTIGVLNLIFGGGLLLYGTGCLNVVAPFLVRNNPLRLDRAYAEEVVDLMRRQMIEDLRAREQSAPDGAEKARVGKVRLDLESASPRLDRQVDFRRVNGDLPWLARYLWADVLTGPVLNLLMIVAGAGLVPRKRWGRKLAVWVAAMKVLRLIGLSAFLAFVVVPHMTRTAAEFARTEVGEAMLRAAMDPSGNRQGALALPSSRLSPAEFVQVLSAFGTSYAILTLAFGVIYPVVVLVVLNRADVRAAAREADPPRLLPVEDFP